MIAAAALSGCALTSFKKQSTDQILTVDSAVYNFEFCGPAQTIQHEFKLANIGHEPISITGASVCCGCEAQSSTAMNDPIAPGQRGDVIVKCTMPRYEGSVAKLITLHTDVPGIESIPLTIKGTVKRDIVILPSSLAFGTLKKGEGAQKQLRVFQMSNQQLNINKVEANPDYYIIETSRFDELNHRGYDVTVRFLANVNPGTHSDVITIHTNDRRRSKIDVPIVAQVVE